MTAPSANRILPIQNWTLSAQNPAPGAQQKLTNIPVPKPELITETLLRNGIIPEPLVAQNCFDVEWIEKLAWTYRASFDLPDGSSTETPDHERRELLFEGIDGTAEIYLNGELLASHRNSYRPLILDISRRAKPAGNQLEIRLRIGLDDFTNEDATSPDGVAFATEESLGYRPRRGDLRRIFQRKPAYGFGWDWCPRVATLGLCAPVSLRISNRARIDRLSCVTLAADAGNSTATLKATVEITSIHYYQSLEATLQLRLLSPDGTLTATAEKQLHLRSGFNAADFTFSLNNAQLWWPNGHGPQPLYTLQATLQLPPQNNLGTSTTLGTPKQCDANVAQAAKPAPSPAQTTGSLPPTPGAAAPSDYSLVTSRYSLLDDGGKATIALGIRTLELADTGTFHFKINGRPIFCQGANWIPPDVIYTRPTDADYEDLLTRAAQANMTILRIWGGGNYERDVFYNTCDRLGLLVWNDFMFACSPYPDQHEWFRREIELEAAHQVQRLSFHPCLALWCGSNENTWAFQAWWNGKTQRGAQLYNEILPRAVRLHSPHTPYWTGSPFGGPQPNIVGIGNNHFWKEPGGSLCPDLDKRVDFRAHDDYRSLFISEYGYLGPCSLHTTLRALGGNLTRADQIDRNSELWHHHTNTRQYARTLKSGVQYAFNQDLDSLPNDDYLFYGALWQAYAYAYSLEAARLRPECSGIIMWMFNESWGEAGWGVIDYYHQRKTSWHYVRRALAPHTIALRNNNGTLTVTLLSTNPQKQSFEIEIGSSTDTQTKILKRIKKRVSSTRQLIAEIPMKKFANARPFARGLINGTTPIPLNFLWLPPAEFNNNGTSTTLATGTPTNAPDTGTSTIIPDIQFTLTTTGTSTTLHLTATQLTRALHLQTEGRDLDCSENYIDLLPGDQRTLRILEPISPQNITLRYLTSNNTLIRLPLST